MTDKMTVCIRLVIMSATEFTELTKKLMAFLDPGDLSEAQRRKRQRIIESATTLFLRHGYRRTSVDEIAREAHVAKGTIYTYFKNKAELLVHAIGEEKKTLLERLAPILQAEVSPEQRLRGWIHLAFSVIEEIPLTAAVMRGDREVLIALDEIDEGLKDYFLRQQHLFIDNLISEAAAPGAFDARALSDRGQLMLALAYSATFITDERIRGGLDLDAFARLLADALVDGIITPPGASS